jgi:hypothetical protein
VSVEPVKRLEAVRELLAGARSRGDARAAALVDRLDEISDLLERAVRLTVRAMDETKGPPARVKIEFDAGGELHQALMNALSASIGAVGSRREDDLEDVSALLVITAALQLESTGADVETALDRAEKLMKLAAMRSSGRK